MAYSRLVRPEDWFAILRPRIGVFDLQNETIFKWLNLGGAWIFSVIVLIWPDSLALVAWCGGHPVGGGFGLEINDGAVVGV